MNIQTVFDKIRLLLRTPILYFSPSPFMSFLYRVQVDYDHQQVRLCFGFTTKKSTLFRLGKYLEYAILLGLMFRTLYFTAIFEAANLEQLFLHYPLLVFLLNNFHFFTLTTFQSSSLFSLFAIIVDHSLHFKLSRFSLTKAAYELVVDNGRHFWALNEGRLAAMREYGSYRSARRSSQYFRYWSCGLDQLLAPWHYLAGQWALYSGIWNSGEEDQLTFHRPVLDTYPRMSTRTRARIVLYSWALEFVVAFANLCVRKYFFF